MRKVDHDSRREEVAGAAARLIAEKGLEALTTRALAKSLGCSIGVLSHYFSSKEEIVIAAFRWAVWTAFFRSSKPACHWTRNPTWSGAFA